MHSNSYSNKKHSANWCHTKRDSESEEEKRGKGQRQRQKQKRCGRNRAKTVENVAQTIGFVIFSKRKTCCAPQTEKQPTEKTHQQKDDDDTQHGKGADMQQTLGHKDAAGMQFGVEVRTRNIYQLNRGRRRSYLFFSLAFFLENISSAHWLVACGLRGQRFESSGPLNERPGSGNDSGPKAKRRR